MTNHLLVDPGENPEGLSQLMKHVADRQTFDSSYLSQGNNAIERQEAYGEYVLARISHEHRVYLDKDVAIQTVKQA